MNQEKPLGENLFIHLQVFAATVATLATGSYFFAPESIWMVASLVACWGTVVLIHAFITPIPTAETANRQILPLIEAETKPTLPGPVTVQVAAPSITEAGWVTSA